VHTLDLSYCRSITDVSALGGVCSLTLPGEEPEEEDEEEADAESFSSWDEPEDWEQDYA